MARGEGVKFMYVARDVIGGQGRIVCNDGGRSGRLVLQRGVL